MAQDDYYYEIQLTNKQLVFYFMAGATGLILSFLAGVMVGRGVDASGEVQAARVLREERIVPEDPLKTDEGATPPVQELTYAQRLESERAEDSLERPPSSEAAGRPAKTPSVASAAPKAAVAVPVQDAGTGPRPEAPKTPQVRQTPAKPPAANPTPAPARSQPAKATSAKPGGPGRAIPPGSFSIQVGAFKDRTSAESVVSQLKGKGFAAFVVTPEGADGLYNVRVGTYVARADAERTQAKLRDQEKFKPFIVKN